MNALALSLLGSSAAAGTLEATFALRNSSSTSCMLVGYPGAELLDASGTPFASAARGGTYSFTDFPSATVTLSEGQSAYFNVGYSDVPSGTEGTCPGSARIEVTPPNDFTQLFSQFSATVCNGAFTVSPVFGAGSPYTQTTAPPEP
ncbi:MAG: DUF4232 domain-containing protein [Acidimicrobiales bacterium]